MTTPDTSKDFGRCPHCGYFGFWKKEGAQSCYSCHQDVNTPLWIAGKQLIKELLTIQRKAKAQAHELAILNVRNHDKNQMLDMLHMVWCSGGCESGFKRYSEKLPDDEMDALVGRVQAYSERLRLWWTNHKSRRKA